MQPSARVRERVEGYLSTDRFLVGLHIRSYWLKVHDVHIYNKFHIQAQDFLDCALSVRNNMTTSKPIRYFVASDSWAITEEWMAKVPGAMGYPGPVIHTGRRGQRGEDSSFTSPLEADEAILKVFVDYFVLMRADFVIQTHGSSWKWMSEYGNVPTLDLEQRPVWCDDHSGRYAMYTHDADIH